MLIGFLLVWEEAELHDAEDSVSNLLLNLFRRALEGRFLLTPFDWEAYVTRATLNQYRRDRAERYRPTPTVEIAADESPERVLERVAVRTVTPSDNTAGEDGVKRIRDWAAKTLPELERRALFARVDSQKSCDIAQALGTTVDTVSVSASRARKKLARFLGINAKHWRKKAA